MKKRAIIAIITLIMFFAICSPALAAKKTKDNGSSHQTRTQKLSFGLKTYSLSPVFALNEKYLTGTAWPEDNNLSPDNIAQRIKNAISEFNLSPKKGQAFSIKNNPQTIFMPKNRKYYAKTTLEVLELNLGLWAFDRFIMNESWAKITPRTIFHNFAEGFEWDYDTFVTNQLGHPYHGAMFHTFARTNGLGFLESTLYTALGSYIWEVVLESIHPSTNDMIMTTFGGITLGEALFRMAGLIIDEDSTGLERALRESLSFLVNPAYGLRVFSGSAYRSRNSQDRPNYVLNFPLGAYSSSEKKTSFVVGANVEYRDYLKSNISGIGPYDWFNFNCRFGLSDNGFHDKELFSTGVLFGKKFKNNLAGLFGVFDYINNHLAERMSALGFGPGVVTSLTSDSNLFFNSSGVLSVIFGGSSPSVDLEEYHLGKRSSGPYFLGTGILGKINLELGKEGLGSIQTGLSRYWVHSMSTPADEHLLISSFNVNYDLSNSSQLRFEYDYYFRNGIFQERRASGENYALRALYVFKF